MFSIFILGVLGHSCLAASNSDCAVNPKVFADLRKQNTIFSGAVADISSHNNWEFQLYELYEKVIPLKTLGGESLLRLLGVTDN